MNILVISAAFSILSASYFTWEESYVQIPKIGDLNINIRDVIFESNSWSNGFPTQMIKVRIIIDFLNRGPEKLVLDEIKRGKTSFNTRVFSIYDNVNIFNEITPKIATRNNRIKLPIDIPGKDHRTIQYEFHVKIRQDNINEIVNFLKDTYGYFVEILYKYYDIYNHSSNDVVEVEGSFDQFRQNLRYYIENQNRTDILILLNEL